MKQVVLVTGAASGLGNVIAEYFAAQGHQVIMSKSAALISRTGVALVMVALLINTSSFENVC